MIGERESGMQHLVTKILFIDSDHSWSRVAAHTAKNLSDMIDVQSAGVDPKPMCLGMESFLKDIDQSMNLVPMQKLEETYKSIFDLVFVLDKNALPVLPLFPGVPLVSYLHYTDCGIDFNSTYKNIKNAISQIFETGLVESIYNQKDNFQTILNSLSEGILIHDLQRRVFYFSDGAEKITGVKREEVLGKDCHSLFTPHLCGGACIFCESCNFDAIEKASYTTIFKGNDSIRKELDVTRLPLKNALGNTVGAIAMLSDTTRVHALENRLQETESFSGIIGQDYKMLALFDLIKDIAESDFSVIVTGESGTGKELVAAAIHTESNRRDHLFVPVNCGALPEGTLESELFGHVKGSFTGAIRDKKGRFELADKGTLFLDEVAELSLPMQVKLLRVLQEGVFEPVGSETPKKVDVRVICATNRNLKEMVQQGKFREDLYYRLAVVPIEMPPLRDRRNDIPLLAQHFLKKVTAKLSRGQMKFSDSAMSVMMSYNWPGNVRQLQNAIQFSLIRCRGSIIQSEHLPPEILNSTFIPLTYSRIPGKAGRKPKLSSEIVERALEKAGGNKAKAARFLGVGRATLYNFIAAHKELAAMVE